MSRRISIIVLMLAGFVLAAGSHAQMKKRVAVFSFEDKTDHTWHWWDGRAPGDGMSDMLTTSLVKSGKYTVVERNQINAILNEQKLGQTGVVTEQSAAQVGKMLGVELAVVGSITEFGYSKKDVGGSLKGFSLGVKKQKATVAVDVRLINTTTGEILKAENVRKEESASGLRVGTPEAAFNNESEFDNSIVGKATRAAIDDIVVVIDQNSESVAFSGKILKINGSEVLFKPGQDAGVQAGQRFFVYSKGEDVIDPDTGLSLGSEEKKIGEIEVTGFMGDKVSKAVIKAGTGFQVGNIVKMK
jgi:curli biogenesis system outer membrane secretion channel CsgG